MHFTVVFTGFESEDYSYSLVFTPVPCWMSGPSVVVGFDKTDPQLPSYCVESLIDSTGLRKAHTSSPLSAVIVVHRVGHGTEGDLSTILADCKRVGISVIDTVRL